MAGISSNSAPFLYPHTKHAWNLPEKVPNSANFSAGIIRICRHTTHRTTMLPYCTHCVILVFCRSTVTWITMVVVGQELPTSTPHSRAVVLVAWVLKTYKSTCVLCQAVHLVMVLHFNHPLNRIVKWWDLWQDIGWVKSGLLITFKCLPTKSNFNSYFTKTLQVVWYVAIRPWNVVWTYFPMILLAPSIIDMHVHPPAPFTAETFSCTAPSSRHSWILMLIMQGSSPDVGHGTCVHACITPASCTAPKSSCLSATSWMFCWEFIVHGGYMCTVSSLRKSLYWWHVNSLRKWRADSWLLLKTTNMSLNDFFTRWPQDQTLDAFYVGSTDYIPLHSWYMDGVSVTYGSPMRHLWTYTASFDNASAIYHCPCSPEPGPQPPSFVGSHYYCADNGHAWRRWTFTPANHAWSNTSQCTAGGTCCDNTDMPWFHRQLDTSSSDEVQIRLCSSYSFDENIGIDEAAIFVK